MVALVAYLQAVARLALDYERNTWVVQGGWLGVRVLGIFGPTDPRLFGPYPLTAPSNVVVQAPVGDLKLLSAKDVYMRFVRARARFK